jgi:secreted Zn-dependent insulinase-like peptidase
MIYHDYMAQLINYDYSDVYTLIWPEFKRMVNKKHSFSNLQLIEALKRLSPEHMENNNSMINYNNFRKSSIKVMTTGNIMGVIGGSVNINQVKKMTHVLDTLIDRPKPKTNKYDDKKYYVLDLSTFPDKKRMTNVNPNNTEKAIGYGLWIGSYRDNHHCKNDIKLFNELCGILGSYISDKFSLLVRTEQEIGYIAVCRTLNVNESTNPEYFLLFVVQSSRNDLDDVVKHYVDDHMMNDIRSMIDDEFNYLKHSAITHISEKPLNIDADVNLMFNELKLKSMNYWQNQNQDQDQDKNQINGLQEIENMNQKHELISKLKEVSKDDFVDFVKNIYDRDIRSILLIEPMSNI